MARRAKKEFTLEDYDAWKASRDRVGKVADAADESGGPRLSLVPAAEQNEALADRSPPAASSWRGRRRHLFR
jgi:hypothetical protein